MKTIYVIGPKAIFYQRFSGYQNKTDFGAIRYSLDGEWTLVQEVRGKLNSNDLAREDVTIYNHEEIKAFLIANKDNWVDETRI